MERYDACLETIDTSDCQVPRYRQMLAAWVTVSSKHEMTEDDVRRVLDAGK